MTATRVFNADGRPTEVGPVQALDPRLRVMLAAVFALVTVSQRALPVLAVLLATALLLALAARLPARPTARRLLALDAFMAVVLLTLPFSLPGALAFRIGPLAASWEGLIRVAEIIIKANAVLLSVLALVGTMEAVALGHALARLQVPGKLVNLLLLTVRYAGILRDQFAKMRMAMRVRAFHPSLSWHTWQSFGWLFGMLLVRSAERAERVLDAMKCRGYRGELHLVSDMRLRTVDWATGVGAAIFFLLISIWGRGQ